MDKSEFPSPGFDAPEFVYHHSIPNVQGMAAYSRSGQPLYWQKPMSVCVTKSSVLRSKAILQHIYICFVAMAQSHDCIIFIHREWLNS